MKIPSITCPICEMISYNKNDVINRYCGNCHIYFGDYKPLKDVMRSDADKSECRKCGFFENAICTWQKLKQHFAKKDLAEENNG